MDRIAQVIGIWWRLLWCARTGHGQLVASGDELWLQCVHCGWSSPGIVLNTLAVRLAWRYDRQRQRFGGLTRCVSAKPASAIAKRG